jgi:hypothetical protein
MCWRPSITGQHAAVFSARRHAMRVRVLQRMDVRAKGGAAV